MVPLNVIGWSLVITTGHHWPSRARIIAGLSSRARRRDRVWPPLHWCNLKRRSLPRLDPAGYSSSTHRVARGAADDGRAIRTGEDPGLYAGFRWEHARHDPHRPHRTSHFGQCGSLMRTPRSAGLWRQDYPHPILQSWCAFEYNVASTVARRSGGEPADRRPTVLACRPAYAADLRAIGRLGMTARSRF
jgi:hypothetical protein